MKFKKGDMVRLCYVEQMDLNNGLILGKIYKINEVDSGNDLNYQIGNCHDWVYEFQLVLAKKYEEPKKDMTISEIEEKLGYKIKVVKEKK